MSAVTHLATVSWPVLDRISIGGFEISPQGLCIAVGFLVGAWLLLREGPKRGMSVDHLNSMIFAALIGGIVGARVFYLIGHHAEFDSIGSMLTLWRGGLSLVGAILGAIIATYPLMRRYHYRFFQSMDAAALGMALGIFVGRLGDLIVGDHLGKPTSWLLGFVYSSGQPAGFVCQEPAGCAIPLLGGTQVLSLAPEGAALIGGGGSVLAQGAGVHQVALYDMLGAGLLFAVLWLMNRTHRREGILFCTFLAWYGAMRVLEDFLRVESTYLGLTGSQWVGAAAVVIGVGLPVWWAIKARRIGPLDPRPSTAFVPPMEPRRRNAASA